jgi:hypothetical protein
MKIETSIMIRISRWLFKSDPETRIEKERAFVRRIISYL